MNENRVMMLRVTYRTIILALRGRIRVEGLPEDFRVQAVNHDFHRGGFMIKGTSSEFEEVEEGQEIPAFEVQFYLKPEKVNRNAH